MTGPKELIDKLHKNQELSLEEWTELIKNRTPELSEYLPEKNATNTMGMTFMSVV